MTVPDKIIEAAAQDPEIVSLYLFGSRARGTANAFSDIDIAVICGDAANVDRAALNRAATESDTHISFTYVLLQDFETDDHPLHVSSSIKREGKRLWQR
jgi:predicted nucleotidyltransferase